MRVLTHILLFILGACCAGAALADSIVPRTVIALYDDRGDGIRTSYLHSLAEMPLNHLGLTVEYYDIHQPLPDISKRPDVRGVITWFFGDTRLPDPAAYLAWATAAIGSGKKFVIMGPLGITDEATLHSPAMMKLLAAAGVQWQSGWVQSPFDVTYDYRTPGMFLTEKPYHWIRPSYATVHAVSAPGTQVHLAARDPKKPQEDSDLIVTSASGGYIAANYIFRTNQRGDDDVYQWLIDPFTFFRQAFATDDVPKPDTTTIAGRRIYYSHIDGDGWNNLAQMENYRDKPTLASQVILDKVVKPNPGLPVTLTVIAADIDPKDAAIRDSRTVAQEFYAQPQVEAGTHTYTHPFFWQLFKDGSTAEEPYLSRYKTRTWQPKKDNGPVRKIAMPEGYSTPRAYAYQPFDLKQEVYGSVKELTPLLPPGKKISVLTWSGNCSPWEQAVAMTRQAGLQNLNGGDSRFDADYPAYASVAPIGIQVGKERQIYSSSSNENTYTGLWFHNFYAYRYLVNTLQNTESPMRLKPLNIYYHIYSGEKAAGLNAILADIDYAKAQDIAPVSASHYTKIAEGFYQTQIVALGPDTWRIEHRGDLQTIRFDHRLFDAVDFQNSQGVVGERYFQGSLYVYLDQNVARPVIALKKTDRYYAPPEETVPYLVESRWLVSGLQRRGGETDFIAQGFGPGQMVWQMPAAGRYRVSIDGKNTDAVTTDGRLLKLDLDPKALHPLHITIRQQA